MDSELYKNIANSTAHRASREQNAHFILDNPELFSGLLNLALNTNDKNHHKACWILELVLEEKPHLLVPFLAFFCETLSTISNDGALRSISKICMFLAKTISLTESQEQKIIESCFDWLILENGKVATKAYTIRALFEFGKKSDWIYPELKRILEDDYIKHSAAYKAVAREILKKIK
jgi:hypothetical protein